MYWTVVGHEDQKRAVERMLDGGALPHALLLTGPANVGKHRFALDVVARLAAAEASAEVNPDVLLLAPGTNEETGKPTDIAVEDVRGMKEWAYRRPLFAPLKAVIIDDADRLGDAAANTLLKVLEEPPAYLRFILVSSRPDALLPTIASRCMELAFRTLGLREMDAVLAGLRLDADDRELLAAVAGGRPGYARRLVESKHLPAAARAIAQLGTLLKSDIAAQLIAAKPLADDELLPDIIGWWLSWVHAQLPARPALAPVAAGLLELSSALGEPKYNRRLALERFFLELP